MADVYRMPAPRPPDDRALDELDRHIGVWLVRIDLDPGARKTLREARDALRNLRIAYAKADARATATQAIAAINRDERVAVTCPGSRKTPIVRRLFDGRAIVVCSRCNRELPADNLDSLVPEHGVPAL